MGSKKRKGNKHSAKNTSLQKKSAKYPQYIKWLLIGVICVLSLLAGVIAGYPVLSVLMLMLINGTVGIFAADYIMTDGIVIRHNNELENRRFWVLTAGIISALSVLIMYIVIGIYPFGDLTVVSGDMLTEYLPFAYARNAALLSQSSLGYSDSLGMGGNFWSLLSYNVSSPFMLFALFSDEKCLDTFMFAMQIIKVGAMGGTFAYFYTEKFGRKDISSLVFSVAYALMAFSVSNMLNIIWLDCIIMLPLIILGLDRIIQRKSPMLYVVCLSWAMITYYYIAFMICIYLVLYYAAFTVIHTDKFNLKEQVKNLSRFALFSMLSAGISSAVLIPSAAAISASVKNSDEIMGVDLINYNPLKLAARFLWGSSIDYSNDALPNVYCSIFVVVLVALFLMCGKMNCKKKVTLSVVAGILMLSTMFSYVDFAWHGFHVTIGLPYRYAFLISFTLLMMAAEMTEYIDTVSINKIIAVTSGTAAVIFAVYFFDKDSSLNMTIVSAIMLLLYITVITARSLNMLNQNAAMALALVLVFTEMTSNGTEMVKQIGVFSGYSSKASYNLIFDINRDLINSIKVSDSDIYRIEDENSQVENQSVYLDYGSLSFYATPNNGSLLTLMDAMGYANDTINKYVFNNYVPFSDSVFNLKYILSADSSERKYLNLTDISNRGKNVYENTLALSRGFQVSRDLLDWDISDPNPFVVQNSMARLATGVDEDIYTDVPQKEDNGEISNGNFVIAEDGIYEAEYILPCDGEVYCFMDCMESDVITVEFNDRTLNFSGDLSGILALDSGTKGAKLKIIFKGESGLNGFVSAAVQNDEALMNVMKVLSESQLDFDEYSDGEFSGSITVDSDCLLFTSIPYDKGWKAYVNGERCDVEKIGGGLVGLKLSAGQNSIKMKYSVPGISAGTAISLVSMALFIIYAVGRKRRKIS